MRGEGGREFDFCGIGGREQERGLRRFCCTGALICCLDSCRYVGEVIGFHARKSLSLLTLTIRKNMF